MNSSLNIPFPYQIDKGAMGDMGYFGDQRDSRTILTERGQIQEDRDNSKEAEEVGQGDSALKSPAVSEVYYFESSRSLADQQDQWTRSISIGVQNYRLESTDRRVLASAIESLLSQNEKLISITSSFYRDVLLNDFPPEVFIQESSLSMVSQTLDFSSIGRFL